MPQAIPAIAVAVAKAYGASVLVQAVVAVAATVVAAKIQERQMDQDPDAPPKELVIRSTTQPKAVVYGHTFTGGLLTYINSQHPGVDLGHELHMAVAVAGHRVEDITDLYLDNDLIVGGSGLNWGTGVVTQSPYYPDTRTDKESVKIWKFLGTSTQTTPTELSDHYPTDWTSNHRLRGIAYFVIRFKLTTRSEKLWASGPPSSIRVKVKGKNDIYDPRLDSSPGNDPTNASYAAWTDNPVLCAADYLRTYLGVGDARIDWASIEEQADICDALVDIPGPSTQKRYTCNGVLSLGETHGNNLSNLLSSCNGTLSKVNGKWRVLAGAYQAATITLTEADIIDPVIMSSSLSRRERFNTIGGLFTDPAQLNHDSEFMQVTNSAYVTRDNGEQLVKDITLPFTQSEYMAQRIAFKQLNQGDQQTTVTLKCRWTGLRVAVGTTVSLTYSRFSWTNKTFRCIGWSMLPDGDAPFELTLREDSASAWADPTIGEYSVRTADGVITVPDIDPVPPQSITATAILGGNQIRWTIPEQPRPVTAYRIYASATSAWSGASVVYEGVGNEFLHQVTAQRYYWGRAVIGDDQGLREPNSDTSSITATPLTAPEAGATAGAGETGEVPIRNANFELGDRFWTKNSTWEIVSDSGNAHRGSYVAKAITPASSQLKNDTLFACNAGDLITATAWVKTTGGGFTGSIGVGLSIRDGSLSEIAYPNIATSGTAGVWEEIKLTTIAPANTEFAQFTLFSNGTSVGTIWGDDCQMVVKSGAQLGATLLDESGNVLDDVDALNSEVVTSSGDAFVSFTYDGTDYQPQRATPVYYTYDSGGTYTYKQGSASADADREFPYLDSDVQFYRGNTLIKTLTFRHLCNYGSESSSSRLGSLLRSVWRSSSGSESDGNFTVDIGSNTGRTKWDGGTYVSGNTYEVYTSAMYGGSASGYTITITHTPSGAVCRIAGVLISTIGPAGPVGGK